jgi:hypothetical protein
VRLGVSDCDEDGDCDELRECVGESDWEAVALCDASCDADPLAVRDCDGDAEALALALQEPVRDWLLVFVSVCDAVLDIVCDGVCDCVRLWLGVELPVHSRGDTSAGPGRAVTWSAGSHGDAQKARVGAHAAIDVPVPNPSTPE